MTQQFKFGDLVRHKETGNIGSVVDFKFGVVVALHGDTHLDTFGEDELELIPHPDTMRLNWLMEEGIIPEDIYHNTQTEDEDGLPYAYFSKHDCRAAIDSAMRRNRK